MPEAARKSDVTGHMGPLAAGPASSNVSIGDMPAWRAMPTGTGGGIEEASVAVKQLMDQPLLDPVSLPVELGKINAFLGTSATAVASHGSPGASAQVNANFTDLSLQATAEMATYTSAAAVPGGEPAARATYTLNMKNALASFADSAVSAIAGMTDIHTCPMPGILPHGPGVVVRGSASVFINDLPATRKGDELFEAAGGSDPISLGCPTVFIDDAGGSGTTDLQVNFEQLAEQVEEQSQLQSTEAALVAAAASGVPLIEVCRPCNRMPTAAEENRATFAVRVVDEETDEPMRNVELKITLPDGTEEMHVTDSNGEVVIDDLDEPGLCEVRCDVEDAINDETADFIRRE